MLTHRFDALFLLTHLSTRTIEYSLESVTIYISNKENDIHMKRHYVLQKEVSFQDAIHCVKSVRIRSFSGLCFPAFGLKTERYELSLCIQSKCGKMWTRKTPNTDTLYAVILIVFLCLKYDGSLRVQYVSSVSFFKLFH